MSGIITERRVKEILKSRESMLHEINRKMRIMFQELSRDDMGVFKDELLVESSISGIWLSGMPIGQGGEKDVASVIIDIERKKEQRLKEMYDLLTYMSREEECINRVWAGFLILDDPYYTILNQLYVEKGLYESVQQEMEMSLSKFERSRKKGIESIIAYAESDLTVSEIMLNKGRKPQFGTKKKNNSGKIKGQLNIMDMINVPDSGTRQEAL